MNKLQFPQLVSNLTDAEKAAMEAKEAEGLKARLADWHAQELERDRQTKLDRACLPTRLRKCIAAPNCSSALLAVQKFLQDPSLLFLVLSGPVGTGKSVAAAWGLAQQKSGLWVNALQCVTSGLYGEPAQEFRDKTNSVEFLVLDELGAEPIDKSGYALASISSLICHRYEWNLKTILTTNLGKTDFAERYDAGPNSRVGDRFHETSQWVHCLERIRPGIVGAIRK